MANKLLLAYLLVIFGFAITSSNAAITYMVGDTSGWDISTDLATWANGKTFQVGDALMFQYSSSHSVSEVTKENYDTCNTTNVINTYSNGNTTVPLTKPGERYFLCGNKLHCLGGMKLRVNVEGGQASSSSPIGSPQSSADLPRPSSKNDNPSSVIPNSSAGFSCGGRMDSLLGAFIGFLVTMLWSKYY